MTYAQLKALHIAGVPPNTDPQRATETFDAYKARMAANGLQPDIDNGESDQDYENRIRSYYPAPASASYALNALNARFAVSASYALSASFAP